MASLGFDRFSHFKTIYLGKMRPVGWMGFSPLRVQPQRLAGCWSRQAPASEQKCHWEMRAWDMRMSMKKVKCIHCGKHGNKLIWGTVFDRKYDESVSSTWAYAALYCCIWLAPGIIADPVASLICFEPPEDERDSRANLEKVLQITKVHQVSHKFALSSFQDALLMLNHFIKHPECEIHLIRVF